MFEVIESGFFRARLGLTSTQVMLVENAVIRLRRILETTRGIKALYTASHLACNFRLPNSDSSSPTQRLNG